MGTEPKAPTDGELVRRTLAHDLRAFDALVARHRESVLATTASPLCDWHEAEDAAQEAFVQALRGFGDLREPAKFGTWLRTIARRCAVGRRTCTGCCRNRATLRRTAVGYSNARSSGVGCSEGVCSSGLSHSAIFPLSCASTIWLIA